MSGNPSDSFVHLHVHTEYSMLDGAARVGDLVAEVARQEMPAIAMTDHGNVFGAFEFYKQATKVGVKPIIGIEAYVAPESRHDKKRVQWASGGEDDVSGGGAYTHMTILAENNQGLANLFRLSSLASLEGYYYKPRMDRELLSRYADGLIATTGCPGGEIQTRLRMGNYREALRAASDYRDIFGAANFYLEVMDHGIDIENRVKADLLKLGKELNLPLLATNDLHYTFHEDAASHEALLCVQSGSTLADPKRFKFDNDEFYLKTPAQMRELIQQMKAEFDFDAHAAGILDDVGLLDAHAGGHHPLVLEACGGDLLAQRLDQVDVTIGDDLLDLLDHDLVGDDMANVISLRSIAFADGEVDVHDDALRIDLLVIINADQRHEVEVAHEDVAKPRGGACHMVADHRLLHSFTSVTSGVCQTRC